MAFRLVKRQWRVDQRWFREVQIEYLFTAKPLFVNSPTHRILLGLH